MPHCSVHLVRMASPWVEPVGTIIFQSRTGACSENTLLGACYRYFLGGAGGGGGGGTLGGSLGGIGF